jgi:multicomponent Na+:H+ antiporter subunit G
VVREVITVVLGGLATALVVAAIVGVIVMRDVFDRLHYVGLSGVAGVALAAAVVVREGPSLIALKALVVGMTLLATMPVLTHATARALHHRQERRER